MRSKKPSKFKIGDLVLLTEEFLNQRALYSHPQIKGFFVVTAVHHTPGVRTYTLFCQESGREEFNTIQEIFIKHAR